MMILEKTKATVEPSMWRTEPIEVLEINEPILVIVRGLPGSGKSTLAKWLVNCGFVHFEADMYFTNDRGEYIFDGKKVHEAHKWCYDSVKQSLKKGENTVVSNTFTRLWEFSPYLKLVERPQVITCTGNFKTIHGIPEAHIELMRKRWEHYNGEVSTTRSVSRDH